MSTVVLALRCGPACGCKPRPSVEFAAETDMARRMDAGRGDRLGGPSIVDKGRAIPDLLLRAASGEPTASEALDDRDAARGWIPGGGMP